MLYILFRASDDQWPMAKEVLKHAGRNGWIAVQDDSNEKQIKVFLIHGETNAPKKTKSPFDSESG
jgi:hypothetical protein